MKVQQVSTFVCYLFWNRIYLKAPGQLGVWSDVLQQAMNDFKRTAVIIKMAINTRDRIIGKS